MSDDRRKLRDKDLARGSDDRGFNRYRMGGRDAGRPTKDKDERRRRRRDSSESRERDDARGSGLRRERARDTARDDAPGAKARAGFRPAPWMSAGGPRPGENIGQQQQQQQEQQQEQRVTVVPTELPEYEDEGEERATPPPESPQPSQDSRHRGQLEHLATLQELGVPVKLLYSQLDEMCADQGIESLMPDDMYADDEPAQRREPRKTPEERAAEAVVENMWPELPTCNWHKQLSVANRNNPPSTVLLLAGVVPEDINNEESLKGHFSKFGTVTQVIPKVNYRPASKFKQGLAIVEMATLSTAAVAMSSQEPVCGNRFVKIFYAPEAARQKVEKEKIANMLKERREKLAEAQMKEAKRNEATARVAAAKAAVTTAKDAIATLKARLQEAPDDTQLADEMQQARAFLKEAFEEHFASLAAWKAVTAKAASPAAPAWQKKGVGFGAHTFDARTTVFKLRSLPVEWQKSPSKMRRAMDKFGEVLGCAVGKKPLQGFVKFSKRFEAERAVRALEEQQHKPEWVDKFKLEGEWPKDHEIVIEQPEARAEVKPVESSAQDDEDKDDDEALVEAELGLRNEELIPVAKEESDVDMDDAPGNG